MKINELTDPRSQTLQHSNEEYYELFKANCSEALIAFKNDKAAYKGFRGMNVGSVFKTDPKLIERRSKNTSNYYTMLLDHMPSWNKYPKRSRSLICTTSRRHAYHYGDSYLVLPFNGAKFGVCPSDDFWYSFDNVKRLNRRLEDMANFNWLFKSLALPDDDYDKFINDFLPHLRADEEPIDEMQSLQKYFNGAKTTANVEKLFNRLLSPVTNGFKLTTVSGLRSGDDYSREVWTDSEAYLVSTTSPTYYDLYEYITNNM